MRTRLLLTLLLWLAGWAHAGDTVRTPHAEVRLLSETPAAVPGGTLWLGIRFDLAPHWHVYWRNPGDSGEPPRADWQLPPGWQAGEIQWPVPERIPVGPLVNYGYEDSVLLLVPVEVGRDASGTARIGADLSWLVCREECIPESGRVDITLPVAPDPGRRDPTFASARSLLPLAFTGQAGYSRIDDGGALELRLERTGWPLQQLAGAWFAPFDWGPVSPSGAQDWSVSGERLEIRLPPGEAPPAAGSALAGLLVVTEDSPDGPLTRGFALEAVEQAAAADASATTLALALLLALLGGLLLNLMPCVLPVLSIKVIGLVQHAGPASGRHGLVFAAGVLATFTALAALLIGLRAGGAALGWGFQLQEPLVVIALMYLMLAVALNLSGVYTLGGGMTGVGQGMTEHGGLRGSFATGVLAVVVASPCTAPFMGTALGFALTRPAHESLLVFLALGAGFALPLLLLSFAPNWTRRLPRPGPWMERLRNALAFPMYGAAAWLLWVLSQQADAGVLAAALAGALLLAFALWWYGQPLRSRRVRLWVSAAALIAGVGLAATALSPRGSAPGAPPAAAAWSAERVESLRAEGRVVLVNFTAAWCITCKVNEQVALDTEAVRAALARHEVAYLKGDWTRRDAAITAELERHGRSGVPLYLLYPATGGEPRVLPQLLTEGLLLQALADITTGVKP
jgi:thiol:disulfide interchange protein DsbD